MINSNKIITQIGQLTPELLTASRWKRINHLRVVKINRVVNCPKIDGILSYQKCLTCDYNYGKINEKSCYCLWMLGEPKGKSRKTLRERGKKK